MINFIKGWLSTLWVVFFVVVLVMYGGIGIAAFILIAIGCYIGFHTQPLYGLAGLLFVQYGSMAIVWLAEIINQGIGFQAEHTAGLFIVSAFVGIPGGCLAWLDHQQRSLKAC